MPQTITQVINFSKNDWYLNYKCPYHELRRNKYNNIFFSIVIKKSQDDKFIISNLIAGMFIKIMNSYEKERKSLKYFFVIIVSNGFHGLKETERNIEWYFAKLETSLLRRNNFVLVFFV